jgi:hypothetical protein
VHAERPVHIERGAGGLWVLRHQLEVRERGQGRDDERDEERQPGGAAHLGRDLPGEGVHAGAEDVPDDEQEEELRPHHPQE